MFSMDPSKMYKLVSGFLSGYILLNTKTKKTKKEEKYKNQASIGLKS